MWGTSAATITNRHISTKVPSDIDKYTHDAQNAHDIYPQSHMTTGTSYHIIIIYTLKIQTMALLH